MKLSQLIQVVIMCNNNKNNNNNNNNHDNKLKTQLRSVSMLSGLCLSSEAPENTSQQVLVLVKQSRDRVLVEATESGEQSVSLELEILQETCVALIRAFLGMLALECLQCCEETAFTLGIHELGLHRWRRRMWKRSVLLNGLETLEASRALSGHQLLGRPRRRHRREPLVPMVVPVVVPVVVMDSEIRHVEVETRARIPLNCGPACRNDDRENQEPEQCAQTTSSCGTCGRAGWSELAGPALALLCGLAEVKHRQPGPHQECDEREKQQHAGKLKAKMTQLRSAACRSTSSGDAMGE
eukprot:CAMPEP_0115117916 /NCGR_PEP_ID=MMETSP0227-20121206/44184_1 /TAXON_ID=89957 /ORGANISM="Polarella glacialis, Strain CCMP 1383" /LENGTH=296 /DNA_ID=CAMNT_0002519093 /DNA_START=76 /DNA_END=968 /DNA_ORIENTATION=+